MPDTFKIKPPWSVDPDEPAAPDPAPKWTSLSALDPSAPAAGELLEPEYADAYRAYSRDRSPAAASKLLEAVKPVIGEALKSYAGTEAGSVTMAANAKRLALEAVRRYDPARAKLRTHLLSHLRGLRRQAARSAGAVYVPEVHRIDAQRVDAALPDLRDRLGRDPSDAELSAATGLDLKRIANARAVTGALTGSQVNDEVSSTRTDPAAWEQWLKIVYHDLDPVDQVILEHSFGLHNKPVLPANEIAARVGLSNGAVSQRKVKIQNMLDEYDTFMGRSTGS